MNFKLFPFRELEDSYKEQSPFSLPLSQTEGKHINKRAHWQARRHAMRSSKAGEGVHTTPPTPWGHGRHLCPHHQETPLSLPVHSNSSLRVFTRRNSGCYTAPQQIQGKAVTYLEIKISGSLKLFLYLLKPTFSMVTVTVTQQMSWAETQQIKLLF